MTWIDEYLPEAMEELRALDKGRRAVVAKAIRRTLRNPLPAYEGGYGKPLGNKGNRDLTGLLKIKLKREGLRVVYKLVRRDGKMLVIVVGIREDEEVYRTAEMRAKKYGL